METNIFPEVISAKECKQIFAEYVEVLEGKPAINMFRALNTLRGYPYDPQKFGIFSAETPDELNLQTQWKIASCYHAADTGKISMSEALSWIDHVEWAGYEWAYEIEDDEPLWPVMIILMEEHPFE